MTFTTRSAAVTAVAALALSGSVGIANADSDDLGTLSVESLSSVTGSLTDTLGSAAVLGSVAEALPAGSGDLGSVGITGGAGAGGVDTSGSLIGEPTSGSLAPVWSELAPVLGSTGGATIKVGSLGELVGGSGSDAGSLAPILIVGGVAVAIGAGIAFAPQIEQALANAGIVLPPLP